LAWEKESILVLVKAAPNWSAKYKKYEICTAGISETEGWRRLYPFPETLIIKEHVRLWDIIEVKTIKPTDDSRIESRKIKEGSVQVIDRIEGRKERRKIINGLVEQSLDSALREKRSLALIEPHIEGFKIEKGKKEPLQFTLNGSPFRRHPYSDVKLIYEWSCSKPCDFCKERTHNSRCFDWRANWLYKKLYRESKDKKDARIKGRNKLHYEMKYDNDTWFVLETTRQRPWKRWMIVGLLWLKKQLESDVKTLNNFS
jgi:hypothetical protein